MTKLNLNDHSLGAPINFPDRQGKDRNDGWVVILLLSLYLIGVLAAATLAILYMSLGFLPERYAGVRIGLMCAAIGAVGGCLYCLRAVYLNRCVFGTWSNSWAPWYLIRPIVSICCGGISFLFLKAGLLVLESGTKSDASEIGFYALALVAGLNVDKFVAKIEDVAQAVWGIDQSRARGRKSSDEKVKSDKDTSTEASKDDSKDAKADGDEGNGAAPESQ